MDRFICRFIDESLKHEKIRNPKYKIYFHLTFKSKIPTLMSNVHFPNQKDTNKKNKCRSKCSFYFLRWLKISSNILIFKNPVPSFRSFLSYHG